MDDASHGRCKTMVALEGELYKKLVMHQKNYGKTIDGIEAIDPPLYGFPIKDLMFDVDSFEERVT